MAGAGGTGPVQQPNQLDDLREQLIQAITNQLHGGEPTAPQYQPAQVSPQQGFAMARNPQLAPMLNQNIQAPAQAQFQQQQAAFEQAMQGRQQAMAAGTNLVNSQQRQMTDPLDYLKYQEMMRHNKAEEDRMAGRKRTRLVYDVKGNAYEQDIDTSQTKPINLPGGEQAGKQPSEATVGKVATIESLVQKSQSVRQQLKTLMSNTPQWQRSGGRMARGVERFVTGATDLTSTVAPQIETVGAAVDDMADFLLRLRSGAQINENEYTRLRSLLPSIGENPTTATQKMDRFDAELQSIMGTRSRLQPNVTRPAEESDPLLEELWGGQ